MTGRRKLLFLLGALPLFALVAGIFFAKRRGVLRFPYLLKNLEESEYRRLASQPGWQATSLNVREGLVLRGLARLPQKSDAPRVLFFSGNSADSLKDAQRFLTELCGERDFGAWVFAYRGYDGNPGKPSPGALESDAWKAYQLLWKDEKLRGPVHVVAFSLGTTIAASVAAHEEELAPASLTLLAPTTQLDMGGKFDLFLHRYETLKYLSKITSPAFVAHGARDATLPVEGGRQIAAQLKAKYLEPPELGHLDLETSKLVIDAVGSFIAENASK